MKRFLIWSWRLLFTAPSVWLIQGDASYQTIYQIGIQTNEPVVIVVDGNTKYLKMKEVRVNLKLLLEDQKIMRN
jgi:hypothetical protein